MDTSILMWFQLAELGKISMVWTYMFSTIHFHSVAGSFIFRSRQNGLGRSMAASEVAKDVEEDIERYKWMIESVDRLIDDSVASFSMGHANLIRMKMVLGLLYAVLIHHSKGGKYKGWQKPH